MNHQKKRVAFESDLEVLYLYLNVRAGWINVILYFDDHRRSSKVCEEKNVQLLEKIYQKRHYTVTHLEQQDFLNCLFKGPKYRQFLNAP